MRVELYGCQYRDGIESYSAPEGDEFAPNVYLEDVYDDQDGVDGLGVLTDGNFAKDGIEFSEEGIVKGKCRLKSRGLK